MAENIGDAYYYWSYFATTGDRWDGITVADNNWLAGQSVTQGMGNEVPGTGLQWNSMFGGTYLIRGTQNAGGETQYAEGATYVYNYFDSEKSQDFQPHGFSSGQPATMYGPGYEYDSVDTGQKGQDDSIVQYFGYGGYFIA